MACNVKCAIDDKFSDTILQPLAKTAEAYKDKFTFKQARLVRVNTDDSVEVENVSTGAQENL